VDGNAEQLTAIRAFADRPISLDKVLMTKSQGQADQMPN
jgi:hypothetical protein